MARNRALRRQRQPTHSITASRFSIESGPLPPPAKLEQYDLIVPGAAERIIKMAEDQAAHRMRLESKVIDSDISNSRRGLNYAFILGLSGMVGGMVLIYFGKTIAGSAISGGTVATLVGTLIYGTSQRKKERADNQKLLQG